MTTRPTSFDDDMLGTGLASLPRAGEKVMKKRLRYASVTILLLLTEVFIALFVHDDFIRPYVGDILVVVLLYAFARVFLPEKHRLLPLWIFLFAVGVECLQLVRATELLSANNGFLLVLMGSSFDVKDILCYAVGCAAAWLHSRSFER